MTHFRSEMLLQIVLIITTLQVVHCGNGTQARLLRQTLFVTNGYDYKVRPAINQSDPTEVYVSFYLLTINGLDEVAETLKTTGYLMVDWRDDYLSWNASDYGGISYYLFPQNDIWKPDVTLKNSVKKYKALGDESLYANVDSTGYVYWYPFEVFESTCSIDIRYFPFDIQKCKMTFVAWSYTKFEIDIREGSKGIDLDQYENNSEWRLIDSNAYVELESDEAAVIYTLTIQRKPLYMVKTVILPVVMLSVLNLFVFVLPCDSGEKASYAVTVFLAFAVFLTIISSLMPANSEHVSVFAVYIIILTVQSTAITVLAVAMIRLSQFKSPVPWPIVKFVNLMYCQPCRKKSTKIKPAKDSKKGENDVVSNEKFANKHNEGIPINDDAFNVKVMESNDDTAEEDDCDWEKVTNALDIFFFCFFVLVTVLSSLVCLLYAASAAA